MNVKVKNVVVPSSEKTLLFKKQKQCPIAQDNPLISQQSTVFFSATCSKRSTEHKRTHNNIFVYLCFAGVDVNLPWLDSEGHTRGNMRKSRSVLTVSPNNVSHHVPVRSHY